MSSRCNYAEHPEAGINEYGVCSTCVELGFGAKASHGKDKWGILFDLTDALREIVKVLMVGEKKYSRGNYINVPNAKDEYWNALIRHGTIWYYDGERIDDGSSGTGRHHLACAGCCLLFLLAMDLRGLFDPKPVEK